MYENENIEKKDNLFFSMELKNITYEIHLDSSDEDNPIPYGVAKVLNEGTDEEVSFRIEVEEVIINIVKIFGNKGPVLKQDISFFLDRNKREKLQMNFFGSWGDLKIDEVSNLEYVANQ